MPQPKKTVKPNNSPIARYQRRKDNFFCLSQACKDLNQCANKFLASALSKATFTRLKPSVQSNSYSISALLKAYPQLIMRDCSAGKTRTIWLSPKFAESFIKWTQKIKNSKSNRTEIGKARFTPKELKWIDSQVELADTTRSKWIRKQCLDANVVISPETTQYISDLNKVAKQLAPIGNNINQISRNINTAVASGLPIPEDVNMEAFRQLNIAIVGLKETIRGLIQNATPEHK